MTGKGPVTHVLMDGGVLHVDNTDLFHRQYIEELRKGNKLYVVELKTEVFRFFVDIDYKAKEALNSDEIISLVKRLNKVIGSRCFIALAEPREFQGLVKTGIHVHWPGILVTKQDAIKLRTRLVLEVPEANEWIDASVYSGSGLRLVWSHKPDSGPYRPWKTIKGDSIGPLPREPSLDVLLLFSIRTTIDSKETVQEDSVVDCSRLEQFIQQNMKGQESSHVLRVFRTKSEKSLCVQTDSKYCERIQNKHRRNHVWFRIKRFQIQQLCLDEDCKAFEGRSYNLPPSILEELKDAPEVSGTHFCFRDAFSIC
jgi:hypothetical protein